MCIKLRDGPPRIRQTMLRRREAAILLVKSKLFGIYSLDTTVRSACATVPSSEGEQLFGFLHWNAANCSILFISSQCIRSSDNAFTALCNKRKQLILMKNPIKHKHVN